MSETSLKPVQTQSKTKPKNISHKITVVILWPHSDVVTVPQAGDSATLQFMTKWCNVFAGNASVCYIFRYPPVWMAFPVKLWFTGSGSSVGTPPILPPFLPHHHPGVLSSSEQALGMTATAPRILMAKTLLPLFFLHPSCSFITTFSSFLCFLSHLPLSSLLPHSSPPYILPPSNDLFGMAAAAACRSETWAVKLGGFWAQMKMWKP